MIKRLVRKSPFKLYILFPWLTKSWISLFIIYTILIVLSSINLIIASVDVSKFYTTDKEFIDPVSIIFDIAVIGISSFWLLYNNISFKSLNYLKRKAIIMDTIFTVHTLLWYLLLVYLSYILAIGVWNVKGDIMFNTNIWLMVTIAIIQCITFYWNIYVMQKQSKSSIYKNKHTKICRWWPNLIYSYWLDKAFFSLKFASQKPNRVVIYNKNIINSNETLKENYDKALKIRNIPKGWTQGIVITLYSALVATFLMSIYGLILWDKDFHASADLITCISLFWSMLALTSFGYNNFITQQFQLLRQDDESIISSSYDLIKLNFFSLKNDKLIRSKKDYSETNILIWLGIIRKILLYRVQFINKVQNYTLVLGFLNSDRIIYKVKARVIYKRNLKHLVYNIIKI